MKKTVIVACCFTALAVYAAKDAGIFSILKSDAAIGKQASGAYLIPTNQLLRPWGEQMLFPGRPVDITMDSKKRFLAVLNMRSVLLIDAAAGTQVAEIKSRATSYTGVAFRPGDRELWASEATRNGPDSILVAQLSELGLPGQSTHIEFPEHPVPAGIAFSRDGALAYVAFSRNNSIAIIDTATRKLIKEIAVDVAPFGVLLSKDRLYVSNRGGRRPKPGDTVSPSSGTEVVTDPVTGAAVSGTLSVIDLKTESVREVVVGLAPSGLAISQDEKTLAVANGHSDSITLVDTNTLATTMVKIPAYPEGTLGSQPIGVAFAPDGRTLYVACGGTNALAVVHGPKWKIGGVIPTAWFPSAMVVDPEGAVRLVNIKGVGNTIGKDGTYNSHNYEGMLEKIPAPLPAQIAGGTREVKASNSLKFEPAGGVANLPSLGIQHVFFVIKENRTYDQVFGDIGKGNSDPKLVFYGREVTPNHHALAEQYVLLDNFYTGGAISFDGHHWLMQAFVSDYVERAFAASPRGYAWNMADALTVSPAGFFWQSATKPLSVRVYGEFCLPARWNPEKQIVEDMNETALRHWGEYWKLYKEGKWQNAVGCQAGVPALKNIMSPRYPNNSTSITDQIRAEEFLRELAEREKSGEMPNVVVLTLPTDHTNGTNPGSPKPQSMVADNDYALGRIVEGISHSRFWPKSLILVVEDDAQNGVDHVDGHRTVALAIGPHVRRNVVDSNHYNHTSMVRTIQEIFKIPARTRFLESARAMTSLFTATPNPAPYQKIEPKIRLDDMNPPLKALNGKQLLAARQSAAMDWAEPDEVPEKVLNQILWWEAKGYDKPYPKP